MKKLFSLFAAILLAGSMMADTYTVVGVTALLGANWDVNATQNDMTDNGDGTYTLVKTDVLLEDGNYDYKVVKNHAWGDGQFPTDGNKTLTLTEGAIYTVTFTYTPATPALVANAVKTAEAPKYYVYVCPAEFLTDYTSQDIYIGYTSNSWKEKKMTKTGFKNGTKDVYGIELTCNPADITYLKFKKDGDTNWYDTKHEDDADKGAVSSKVYIGWKSGVSTWIDVPATTNASAVYLTGSFNNWTEKDENYALTQVDGNHWVGSFVLDGASSKYQFKVYAVDAAMGVGYMFSANGYWFGDNTTATQLWSNNDNDQIVPLYADKKFYIDVEYFGEYGGHGQLTVIRNKHKLAATGAAAWTEQADGNDYITTTTAVGKHGTICLPYNCTVEGALIYAYSERTSEGLVFDVAANQQVEAGHAYIYFATEATQTWTRKDEDEAVDVDENGLLVGTYSQITLVNSEYFLYTGDTEDCFHPAGQNVVLPAFRACIPNMPNVSDNAPVRLIMPKAGVTTGVENAADYKATKAMVDGKIVILRGAKSYNVAGQAL